jgi:hypothetical protein
MRGMLLLAVLAGVACGGGRTTDRRRDGSVDQQVDDGMTPQLDLGSAADLAKPKAQTPCPCALGSYCDHATNLCVVGCLGNDHCPPTDVCDSDLFTCRPTCKTAQDCSGNRDCKLLSNATGIYVCKDCAHTHDDCNGDDADGCETKLDTPTNCGKCGQPGVTRCAIDNDNDGYGLPGTQTVQCSCPVGLKSLKGDEDDCDDANASVNPGQKMFQPSDAHGGDYNCDGEVELGYEAESECNASCDTPAFWYGAVPACGKPGIVAACYLNAFDECRVYKVADVVMDCR